MKVLQEYPLSLQGSLKQKQYIIQLTIEVLDVGQNNKKCILLNQIQSVQRLKGNNTPIMIQTK